jgi:DNA-binding response OmpR family regulator
MPFKKVMILDTDLMLVEQLRRYLKRDSCEVITTCQSQEALHLASEFHPDLIAVGKTLPERNKVRICLQLRQTRIPIMMLIDQNQEPNPSLELDAKADYYISKTIGPSKLAARIRIILRLIAENPFQLDPPEFNLQDLTVNFCKQEVYLNNQVIFLTALEFKLLGILIQNPNQVISRDRLIKDGVGYHFNSSPRSIDVHILNLRRKIEPNTRHPKFIETIYGSGYRFNCDSILFKPKLTKFAF